MSQTARPVCSPFLGCRYLRSLPSVGGCLHLWQTRAVGVKLQSIFSGADIEGEKMTRERKMRVGSRRRETFKKKNERGVTERQREKKK